MGTGCPSNAGSRLVVVSGHRAAADGGVGLDLGWVDRKPEVSPARKGLL